AWRRGRRQLPVAAVPAPARRPADGIDQDRRALLATGAVGAAVLAAAGLDAGVGRALRGGRTSPTATPSSPPPTTAPGSAGPTPSTGPTSAAPAPSASGGSSSPVAGAPIGAASDLPVGGALRFTDPASGNDAWAVQPQPGVYRAYNATCTHAGCEVDYARSARQFRCPCHGGVYDGATGAVLAGPPPAPLR